MKNSELEKFQEELQKTYRNITKNPNISLNFDENFSNNFFHWSQNNILNYNYQNQSQINFFTINLKNQESKNFLKELRPSLDLACLYLLYHDANIHQNYLNNLPNQVELNIDLYKIFNDFEKIRLIILSSQNFLGITYNLLNKIDLDLDFTAPNDLSLILLSEAFQSRNKLALIVNAGKKNMSPVFHKKYLPKILALKKYLFNQEIFAKNLLKILENLILDNQKSDDKNPQENKKNDESDPNFGAEKLEGEIIEESTIENLETKPKQLELPENSSELTPIEMPMMQENEINSEVLLQNIANNNLLEFKNLYQIYTNQFDEIINPKKFLKKDDLANLRNQLDIKISKLSGISKKLAIKLKRKLLSKKNNYYDFDGSGGVLNRKRLANLIISPFSNDIWLYQKNHEYQDTALTILLDNSGSMRGNPIVMSALACELIAETLEKFSIKTEIIGFTTSDWKGGKSRKLWEISGKQKNPGRLNDLRHIIYKDFNQSYKKSKINLGLMLKEGLLKENIDGEALLFARSRLMQQNEKRKIIMVISDGTPVDDSTTANNEGDILSDHLHHVINNIEKGRKIEIIGIGIGHLAEEFYKNSITIKTIEELGDVMIDKIINVL